MKQKIIYIITLIFALLTILIGSNIFSTDNSIEVYQDFNEATVLEIVEVIHSEDNSFAYELTSIYFKAEINSGELKGRIVESIQEISPNAGSIKKQVEIGDNIILLYTEDETWIFAEYNRIGTLIFLCILFFAIILIIGRFKGLNTILALLFTCGIIFLIYIPGILAGANIYILTIILAILIITVSLLLINGADKKTLGAIIGNISGILITGILAFIFNNILNLTGFLDSDYVLINQINNENPIDLVSLIWSGIIIGSIGAVMDIAMSVSSSINEISIHMKEKSFKKLFISGMNVGKDAIGTMTNTLILAYIGSSIATVLLLTTYTKNTLYLFNMEMIIVEILQSVIGSIGILIAVPMTALFAAYLFSKEKK